MQFTATPQRLYLMQVAALPPPASTPAVCYFVQLSDGTNIVIDSGLPDRLPETMPPLIMGANVLEQLALLNVQPDAIDVVIGTHFDLDHAGQHGAFRQAKLIVQRAHYEAALREPRFAATRAQWDQPLDRYVFVDGDTTLAPGLELIATSGHVPGHQSVLVQLPHTGAVLLTIDAVPDQASFSTERIAHPRDMDAAAAQVSTNKLLTLVAQRSVALVIFGHDGAQWQTLKHAPDYYP
jgi:N-acyl homoserine lactone hydrolase